MGFVSEETPVVPPEQCFDVHFQVLTSRVRYGVEYEPPDVIHKFLAACGVRSVPRVLCLLMRLALCFQHQTLDDKASKTVADQDDGV